MSDKNYGDIRHLALGNLSHQELANKILQMNSTSAELTSVLRGAHDRIQHLATTAVVATNDSELETLRRQLADVEQRLQAANTDLTRALFDVSNEKERADNLQGQVNSLNAELTHIRDTYDMEDDDGDAGLEGESVEDRENEIPNEGYMPTRPELKAIALENGFKTRAQNGGADDLNEYVYVTMEKSIEYAHSKS